VSLLERIERDGYAIVPAVLDDDTVVRLTREFLGGTHAVRNLLQLPSIQELARSKVLRSLIEQVLGAGCFAVRGTFFDKIPQANWKVPWHQDRMIPVRQRSEANGFRLWSVKEGVTFVQPPIEVMNNILAVRLHLDEVDEHNAPLRVLPGSHRAGYISDSRLGDWQGYKEVICICPKGSALLMRPLLLHASSPAKEPAHRRVIHLEFAASELPDGIHWYEQV
jgi:ectoine hydroxylase-related dioxygenase (phytanoyl-CoA dioxygenase family)